MAVEQASWHTDEQFHLLVEGVQDYAIFLIDLGGKLVSWNPGVERLLGYTEAEFVGRPFSCIFTPDDVEQGQPEHELKTAALEGRAEDERWHVRKDGTRFWAEGIVTALRDEAGDLRCFAKVLRDRTDQKELQEALRHRAEALVEADERKNAFLATLAHELRNPLAPILNALHVLRQVGKDNLALNQPLKIIERQAQQLRRLVDDLLDVVRVRTGKVQLRRERVELRAVIEPAVEATRPLAESRKHHVAVSLPALPVWLEADPARLQQVFVNLLTNAAKYTDEGGHVWLDATFEDDEVVVRVRDTGIGISAEMMPRLFEMFTQAEDARQHCPEGLGLGLPLVRNLVELHGGTVQVRSDGVGRGSEFIVRLPGQPQ